MKWLITQQVLLMNHLDWDFQDKNVENIQKDLFYCKNRQGVKYIQKFRSKRGFPG